MNGFAFRHQRIFTSIIWYLLIILSKFMYLTLLIIPFLHSQIPREYDKPAKVPNKSFCPILYHMGIMLKLNYHCKNLILNLNFNFGVD